jgi:hypothetical protein
MAELHLLPHPLVVAVATAFSGGPAGVADLGAATEAALVAKKLAKNAVDEVEQAAESAVADYPQALNDLARAHADVAAANEEKQEAAHALAAAGNAEQAQANQAHEQAQQNLDQAERAFEQAKEQVGQFWAADALATLAGDARLPDLVSFAGYLGTTIDFPRGAGGVPWQLLYLDTKLLTWLIVQPKDVVFHQRLHDDRSPFDQRDVIWVSENAPVARSSRSPALWLGGEFTRAADFTPPLPGGTAPTIATGIFCEAQTPNCCPPRTR